MPGTAEKDLYKVLGVAENASKEDIRKAYLKLAKKYHPDKTGGDKAAEERLKEINNAYDILKNPEKRREYDTMRRNPFGGSGEGFNGFRGFNGASPFGDAFQDIFADLFGGSAGRQAHTNRVQPGNDIEAPLEISLQEAAEGITTTIHVAPMVKCGTCSGSGAAPGSSPETCSRCGGSGMVSHGSGHFLFQQTCPDCRGRGTVISAPCSSCGGNGHVREKRRVSVNIPAGVETGSRLRVAGQGDVGSPGAPAGDLYIFIRVQDDPFFTRQGRDIACTIPITFPQAALGAEVRVPTLKGKADLRIPPGTQSGRTFRLRGMGMPVPNGAGKGDLLVTVQVETPARLSEEEEALIRRLAELDDTPVYPKRQSFLKRLRETGRYWAAMLTGAIGYLIL